MLRRLFSKHRPQTPIGRAKALLRKGFFIASGLALFATGLFFAMDEDMLYFKLFLFNQEQSSSEKSASAWIGSGITDGSGSGGGGGSSTSSGSGAMGTSTGLNLMYINSVGNEYIRDWLSIVRDHCNWKYMQAEKPQLADGGDIPLSAVIGGSICESGSIAGCIPYASVNFKNYKKDSGAKTSLYTFNTSIYNSVGNQYIGYPIREGNYRTQFQLTRTWAAISPVSGESYGKGSYSPSKLNGAGISSGKVRDNTGTDMAFFPDQVSMYLQSTACRLDSAVDVTKLNSDALVGLLYSIHNGGPGLLYSTWSVGGRAGTDYSWTPRNTKFGTGKDAPWNSKNTMSKGEIAALTINKVSGVTAEASQDIANKIASGGSVPSGEPSYFEGLSLVYMLSQPGCFTTSAQLGRIDSRLNNSSIGKGAVDAYNMLFNKSARLADVKSWIRTKVSTIDTSFYGPACTGKNYGEWVIYWLDQDIQVYNSTGAGPKPCLHAFPGEGLRGFFCADIMGRLAYWRMLVYAGVNVTYDEACGYVIQNDNSSSGSTSSDDSGTYWEGRILGGFTQSGRLIVPNSPICLRNEKVHKGEDYGKNSCSFPSGTPWVAIATGTIEENRYQYSNGSGWGWTVLVKVTEKTSKGKDVTWYYRYAHMREQPSWKIGATVKRGEVIGIMGNTGGSFGEHMHIEITKWVGDLHLHMSYYALRKGYYTIEEAFGVNKSDSIVYDKNGKRLGRCDMSKDPDWGGLNYWRKAL